MEKGKELVVIGGGPGGYVAAIRASQLGHKVTLVEKEELGGTCLNWGCIPTKALLHVASMYRNCSNAGNFGIHHSGEVTVDLREVIAYSRSVVNKLTSGVKGLMHKHKVEVIKGWGRLAGNRKVEIEESNGNKKVISAENIIIATGARPRELPNLVIDHSGVWDYKDALSPTVLPASMLIVGAGAIGLEFACFYRALGTEVFVVEAASQIMPSEDEEIAVMAQKSFEQQGIKFFTGYQLKDVKKNSDHFAVEISNGQKKEILYAEKILSAVGNVPNTENIGLEKTKIERKSSGHIVVDEYLSTCEPGVYAIGDIVNPPFLAHKASHEAIICVEKMSGMSDVHPLSNIPACIYTFPQVASVGLNEKSAKAKGLDFSVGRFPLLANGKAIAMGKTDGIIKVLVENKSGEILGVQMFGYDVTELISTYSVAISIESTIQDIASAVFPHPTLGEAMHEAALAALKRPLHF